MNPEIAGLIIPGFIAGILTFLAPCTLPLVPAYLGFISGISAEKLADPATAGSARRKILLNGLFFVAGLTLVFVLFGTLAGLAGQTLAPWRVFSTRAAGIIILLFGLFMLGALKIPLVASFLSVERRLRIPLPTKNGNPLNAAVLGGAFAFGWTPCVGPILGSILLLASTSSTALQGGFLLFVFSIGLAVPFLLIAAAAGSATNYIKALSPYLRWVEIIGGLLLLFIGFLLLTNRFAWFIARSFQFLEFLNYDRLLEYL